MYGISCERVDVGGKGSGGREGGVRGKGEEDAVLEESADHFDMAAEDGGFQATLEIAQVGGGGGGGDTVVVVEKKGTTKQTNVVRARGFGGLEGIVDSSRELGRGKMMKMML